MSDETRKVIMCGVCRDDDDSWENRYSLLISSTELENAVCPVCNKLNEDDLWEYEFFVDASYNEIDAEIDLDFETNMAYLQTHFDEDDADSMAEKEAERDSD